MTQDFEMERSEVVDMFFEEEKAELDGDMLGGGFSLGGSIDAGPVRPEPFAGVSYRTLSLEGHGRARGGFMTALLRENWKRMSLSSAQGYPSCSRDDFHRGCRERRNPYGFKKPDFGFFTRARI